MIRRPAIGVVCVIGVACAMWATPARGQNKTEDPAKGLSAETPQEVARALRALGKRGDRAAVRAIAERIEQGLPRKLLLRAVDALVATEQRAAGRVLAELAGHRHADVRARLAQGLAELGSSSARKTLEPMLDDPAAAVRSAAASALGELGAAPTMDKLVQAASRGVPEAALAIGQQAKPHQVRRVARALDPDTFEALAPALRIFLRRGDLPRPSKTEIVSRIAEIGGLAPLRLLQEVSASLRKGDPVRKAAEEAIERLRDGDDGDRGAAEEGQR